MARASRLKILHKQNLDNAKAPTASAFDAENRLASVTADGEMTEFVYDGDGNRVKATFGSATTVYIGNYYEKQGSTVRKYYYAGGARVAMRHGSTLYYLLSNHLGRTAITTYSSGSKRAELRYYPWGKTRYSYGVTPTSLRFTGQREDATIGLYFYNARFYDPSLGRFISADTIVPNPGNPQDLTGMPMCVIIRFSTLIPADTWLGSQYLLLVVP